MKIRCVKSCVTVRPIEKGWSAGDEMEVSKEFGRQFLQSVNFEEVDESRSSYKTREMKAK